MIQWSSGPWDTVCSWEQVCTLDSKWEHLFKDYIASGETSSSSLLSAPRILVAQYLSPRQSDWKGPLQVNWLAQKEKILHIWYVWIGMYMCVCMCVYVYVRMYVCLRICVCVCVDTYVYLSAYTRVHMCICVCICMFLCIYIPTHTNICLYVCICMFVCLCMCIFPQRNKQISTQSPIEKSLTL